MGDPLLRLWIIGTLFIMFYAISAITDYAAATGFGIMFALTIPLWGMHIPAEIKVENTLWVPSCLGTNTRSRLREPSYCSVTKIPANYR